MSFQAALLTYLFLMLLTAVLYAADWLGPKGEIIDCAIGVVLLLVGVAWPVSLPYLLVHWLRGKSSL